MGNNRNRHFASSAVLLAFLIFAVGSGDTDTDTQEIKNQEASFTLTANELYSEYDHNEVAADSKYKGKVVAVDGIVQDIGKDIMDDAYIVIGGSGFLDGVQCMFTSGEQSKVANLSKGQKVSVKGEVSGKMGNVLVNKCSFE